MRQLDLFGSLFETPAGEEAPAREKEVSKKEEPGSVATEAARLAYSRNTLRSQRLAAPAPNAEQTALSTKEVLEEQDVKTVPATVPTSSLSLFDEPQVAKNEISELNTELDSFAASEPGSSVIKSEPKKAAVIEVTEKGEVKDPIVAEKINVSQPPPVATELAAPKRIKVSKPLKATLPELQRTGAVIFDDGKITVKLKNRSPFPAPVEPIKKEKVKKPAQKRGRKSFKEIDAEVDLIEIPEDEVLFQKQYYPISEVAKWFRVNTSLLRFWENEFDVLKPRKNRKGDRLFRPEDVKNLQLIYQLLRQRKYTIEGAKEYIKTNKKKADIQLQLTNTLQKFRSFLLDLKANLE